MGDERPEQNIDKGALRRLRLNYDREKRSTRLTIDLQPGVSSKDIIHRKLSSNTMGQIIVLIDRPQGSQVFSVEEEAKALRDQGKRIVIIDPGHGWFDPGCQYYEMQEKTIVLDIAQKLAYFINQTDNMKAFLTREGDYLPLMDKADYSGTLTEIKDKSLGARVEFASRMHGNVFVSLHLNYCPGRKRRAQARGFEIFCLGRDRSQTEYKKQLEDIDEDDLLAFGADLSASDLDGEAEQVLLSIQRDITIENTEIFVELLKNQLLKVRGLVPRDPPIKTRGFRVLRTLSMPSALVELAFLTNPNDATNLKKTDFRWKLAKSLYDGIAVYFEQNTNGALFAANLPKFEPKEIQVPAEEYDIHVVKSGDKLFTIAQIYGTNVTTLQRINNKGRSVTIHIGEELKVPKVKNAPATSAYVVRTGDTLYEIAQRYNMSVDELKNINRLKSNDLQPGDKLQVSSTGVKTAQAPTTSTSKTRTGTYKVSRGDNLYDIARKFHTSVPYIKALNGIRSNTIKPGQKLRVPIR